MKRRGGVPPVVTALVTIASIIATSLVAWFLFTATQSAVQQPLVEVIAAYAIGSGTSWRISVNIRNIGSVDLSSVSATLEIPTSTNPILLSCTPATLARGQSISCSGSVTASLADGMSAVITVQGVDSSNRQQRIPIGVKLTVP